MKQPKMLLVGLTGLARSGKDTVADYLVAKHRFKKVAFAGPLKEAASILLNRSMKDVSEGDRTDIMPEFGFSIREFLQKMGTEVMREQFHKDFWLILMKSRLEAMQLLGEKRIVITDVRFENESDMVRSMGGRLVHISRPGVVKMKHASEAGVPVHPSDILIENDRELRDLYADVECLMEYLTGKAA